MSAGHAAPLTLSDIPCESCGLYFTLDGDLIAHRASEHIAPTSQSSGEKS